jgi:hypothetical protein
VKLLKAGLIMRNSRRLVLGVAGMCTFVAARSVGAQAPDDIAIFDCHSAIVLEVGRTRPEAIMVRVVAKPVVAYKSKRVMSVHGAGRYVNRNQGEWRAFTFACTYHNGSAKPRVALRLALGQ